MNSAAGDPVLPEPGFPIRTSADQRSFASFPRLIAGYHVLLRLSMPRHPPCTLSSLTTFIDHRPCRAWQKQPAPRPCKRPGRTIHTMVRQKVLDDSRPGLQTRASSARFQRRSGRRREIAFLNLRYSLVKEPLRVRRPEPPRRSTRPIRCKRTDLEKFGTFVPRPSIRTAGLSPAARLISNSRKAIPARRRGGLPLRARGCADSFHAQFALRHVLRIP
jgi:hypothetical protein